MKATLTAPSEVTTVRLQYASDMALPIPKDNTTALVTGASSGIGSEIARELARRGHGVTLVARREDRLKALADELASTHHVRTEVIAADLTDSDSRGELPELIEERGLTVDLLVNNAGFTTMGPVYRARAQHRARHGADERGSGRRPVHALRGRHGHPAPRRGPQHRLDRRLPTAARPSRLRRVESLCPLLWTGPRRRAARAPASRVTTLCPGPVETGFAEVAGMTDAEAGETLPKIMWVPAEDVARATVEGMAAARSVVIPGAVNRTAAALAHLAPKSLLLPMMAQRHPAMKSSSWNPTTPPQPVSELTLPSLDTAGLERADAAAAIEEARAQHWLARSELGYAVTSLSDVTAILRDKRFHSALSMITQIEGIDESDFQQGRRQSILSMEGDEHARLRRLVAPAFTPASANRLRPRMRSVVNDLVDQVAGAGRMRAGRRRLRALPHPDHLRTPGRPTPRLEALLGLGHRHLPDLQRQPARGPAPHRTSRGRALRLRAGHDRGAPHAIPETICSAT